MVFVCASERLAVLWLTRRMRRGLRVVNARSLRVRYVVAAVAVGLVLSGCGGDDLSLTEYVDRLNEINGRTVPQADALITELELSTTPGEAAAAMAQMAALRIESVEATEELEPPEQVADVHRLLLGWERDLIPIEEAFAARAGAVGGWEELVGSDEVAAYRAALVEGKQLCIDFQATLDATTARGQFADTPWIPAELSEVVEARLGCELFPDNPEDVFRLADPDG